MSNEGIWVNVIEDDAVHAGSYKMSALPLDEALHGRETVQDWLESLGLYDIVDFRVVMGDRVTPWAVPELEWAWIEAMTEPYKAQLPSSN